MGEIAEAKDFMKQALAISWQASSIPHMLIGLAEYARVVAVESGYKEAFEILGLILAHPSVDRLSKVAAIDTKNDLGRKLSDKDRKAAMKRAEKLELEEVVKEILGEE